MGRTGKPTPKMKITIEPTECHATHPFYTVTISHPHDDINIDETLTLTKAALQAWGFHQNLLEQHIQTDLDNVCGGATTQRSTRR
jgi:hypothetical protein